MRQFLIIIISILFLSFHLKGQTYTPLVKDYATWINIHWADGGYPSSSSSKLVMEGDTILFGETYKVVKSMTFDSLNPSFHEVVAFLREDSLKRVYVRHAFEQQSYWWHHSNDTTEHLLYDFGTQVGDTLYYNLPDHPDSLVTVTNIDTFDISGHQRLIWTMNFPTENKTWIEGIGDFTGLYGPYFWPFESGTYLGCYYDDEIYHRSDTTRSCQSLDIEEFTGVLVNFHPNPTTGPINIDLGTYYNEIETRTYNSQGQLLDSRYFKNVSEIELDIDEIEGLYFIQIIGDDFNQSFRIIKQ